MAEKLADAVVYLMAENAQLTKDLGAAEGHVRGFSVNVGKILKGALAGATAGAVGGAVLNVGKQAFSAAQEVEGASAKMRGQLNLTAEEGKAFEATMRAVYRNNFGESYEDVAEALAATALQFERIGGPRNQTELQAVTEAAFAIRDAFGEDVNESVGAVVTLMDNFGITSQEALDFIAGGFQNGLNASGDFLDSIGEYSNQFGNMGADAGEFFSVLGSGLQGGMLGSDKVADLFKEFNVRILDDSKTTRKALEDLGIDYGELAQGFADGSITQIDAMNDVIRKIKQIEDPIARNVTGVALFGSQWEDLTETVVYQIDTQSAQLEGLEGSIDSVNKQNETLKNDWETAMRAMKDALVPVGDALAAILTELLPPLTEFINTRLVPALEEVASIIGRVEDLGLGGAVWENIRPEQGLSLSDRFERARSEWDKQWGLDNNPGYSGPAVTVNQNFYGNADAATQGTAAQSAYAQYGMQYGQ